MIRVVIADDQEMVRDGLQLILSTQPDIEVVAEAIDGRSAVDACLRVRPDVCLLDVRMPGLDGIGALVELQRVLGPDAPAVVMVTTFDMDEYIFRALKEGARGYITKDAGSAVLVEAVRAAAKGEAVVTSAITVRLIQTYTKRSPIPLDVVLTSRERDVLSGLGLGLTNQELAASHHVSISTVKSQIASLLIKVGARNRVELAVFAWEHGISTVTDSE